MAAMSSFGCEINEEKSLVSTQTQQIYQQDPQSRPALPPRAKMAPRGTSTWVVVALVTISLVLVALATFMMMQINCQKDIIEQMRARMDVLEAQNIRGDVEYSQRAPRPKSLRLTSNTQLDQVDDKHYTTRTDYTVETTGEATTGEKDFTSQTKYIREGEHVGGSSTPLTYKEDSDEQIKEISLRLEKVFSNLTDVTQRLEVQRKQSEGLSADFTSISTKYGEMKTMLNNISFNTAQQMRLVDHRFAEAKAKDDLLTFRIEANGEKIDGLKSSQNQLENSQNQLKQSQKQLEQSQEDIEGSQERIKETQKELKQSDDEMKITQNELKQTQNKFEQSKQQMEHAQNQLNLTATDLKSKHDIHSLTSNKLTAQQNKLKDCVSRRVGFTATISKSYDYAQGQPVVFDKLLYSSGLGYDNHTGRFTCSLPGEYRFSVYAISKHKNDVVLHLRRNSQLLTTVYTWDPAAVTSGSTGAVVHLAENDVVDVVSASCCTSEFYTDANLIQSNVFTGHLVSSDDCLI